MNDEAAAYAGQRATAEAIERGGLGLDVSDLLAMVMTPEPEAGAGGGPEAGPEAGAGAEPAGGAGAEAPTVAGAGGARQAPADADTAAAAAAAAAAVPAGAAAPAAPTPTQDGTTAPAPDLHGLAAAIATAAGRHLPQGHLDVDADFFDAGGSSVHAVELAAELERELGVELDLDDVFADARPVSLARRWLETAHGPTAVVTAPSGPAGRTAAPPLPVPAPRAPQPVTTLPLPDALPAPPALPVPARTVPARPAQSAPAPLPPYPATALEPAPHTTARRADLDQILADLALADRLPFVRSPEPVPPRRILLTGASGFLGGHMLLDLLRHSDAHVYCLVRGADEAAATARLAGQLRSYRLPWNAEVRRRVTVLPGDIRSPRLGLPDELWDTLAHEIDSIVGVAAAVDFLRGYPSLRASNVLGTLTLAELAATGRPKPLHHISSVAVFNEVGISSMGEDDPFAHVDRLIAGYDQSKWAAEVALRRARDHGLIVSALRPGGIGGHTKTGAHNPLDLSSGLISAFGRFRTVPAFRYLNAAPVDWVSRVAVAVVCEPDAWGFDYNLTGVPNTLDDVVRDMAFGGMHVRVQDWDEWRADTLARLEAEPVPELGFLARVLQSPTALKLCEATLKGPAATAERTDALVEALGLPPAARYDAQAQLKTFEKLAGDGLARLPQKSDQPYLWFAETTEGSVRPTGNDGATHDGAAHDSEAHGGAAAGTADSPCSMALTLSIASMYQLVKERRVDVSGEVVCPAAHPGPLTVVHGDVWVRPDEGIPHRHGMKHQLLRYRLRLRDADGGLWWLEGHKYARARRDLWQQTRTLSITLGREGEPAALTGRVVVPADSYVRDQIDGIRVAPHLTGREKRTAKLTWLAWFGLEMGRGLAGPFARAAADLLDLRRPQNPTERHR
ncbi:thioester reductase domain-containing protein [Streptomyces sp. NPDC091281]|uniref:thioester reductase domain-containing protein n=1 Tax=Streptomyces sp. NPDC091281 TaxID=3365985 RepID=UPI0037F5A2EF